MRVKSFFIKLINILCVCVILFVYQGFAKKRWEKIEAMEEKAGGYTVNVDSQAEGIYTDGTYTGSAQGFGGMVEVQIVIENGRIVSAKAVKYDDETPDYFKQAETIFDEVVKTQSMDVDVVTGATYSSNGIINGLKQALEKAEK